MLTDGRRKQKSWSTLRIGRSRTSHQSAHQLSARRDADSGLDIAVCLLFTIYAMRNSQFARQQSMSL